MDLGLFFLNPLLVSQSDSIVLRKSVSPQLSSLNLRLLSSCYPSDGLLLLITSKLISISASSVPWFFFSSLFAIYMTLSKSDPSSSLFSFLYMQYTTQMRTIAITMIAQNVNISVVPMLCPSIEKKMSSSVFYSTITSGITISSTTSSTGTASVSGTDQTMYSNFFCALRFLR